MIIRYDKSEVAWEKFRDFFEALILSSNARRVCEVGGGANPTLSVEFIKEHGLEYTVMDISEDELAKAPEGYVKVLADITVGDLDLAGSYDLVFSKMLAEHVKNGKRFHENVYKLLAPGGRAFHFFPTLYAPPFIINRMLPESLAERLLYTLQSGREGGGRKGKFPAYYQWCRGPTRSQIRRFEGIGYQVEKYIGFFGHSGYYKKILPVMKLHEVICRWLVNNPIPSLTSFAYIVLVKP